MTTRSNNVAETEVDFNDREPDGTVPALDEDFSVPPAVGLTVRLHDDGGNQVWGTVRRVHGHTAFIEPDWPSWISGMRVAWVTWEAFLSSDFTVLEGTETAAILPAAGVS